MRSRLSWAAMVSTVLSLVLLVPPSFGEVSVEVDDAGVYRRTVLRTNQSSKNFRIWGVIGNDGARFALNPNGDGLGDLWPAIAENPRDGGRSHVVWSRFDGASFDLVWSRWTDGDGWSAPDWLVSTATAGDDLDPDLEFDPSDGRPRVAWWVDDGGGRGEVFVSLFLSTRWMAPYRVSLDDEDARYPAIEVLADGTIRVTFETPDGPRVRLVKFHRPDTITDDLNPLEYLSVLAGKPSSITECSTGLP